MSLRPLSECQHVFGTLSTGTIALVAAVAGQRARIYRMIITIGTPAVTITVQDTVGPTALSQAFQLIANSAITLDTPINGDPWWVTSIGGGLQLLQSGTTAVGFDVWYLQGP